jgi:hypothetical protein
MVVYYLIDRFKSFLNICLIFISKNKPQHTYQKYSNKNEKNNLKLKYKPLKKYIYILKILILLIVPASACNQIKKN